MYGGPFIVLCLLLACVLWQRFQAEPWKDFQLPDDVAAGRVLLAQKLSGPRYFMAEAKTDDSPFPFITRGSALRQIDRVVRERNLGPEGGMKVEKLVDRLVEEPASRVFGAERINVLRLNLALDEMP